MKELSRACWHISDGYMQLETKEYNVDEDINMVKEKAHNWLWSERAMSL